MGSAPRRSLVWAARLGLLTASLGVALLLLVLLDPLLPGLDRPPDIQSETFHHTRQPGVWTTEQYGEFGPHPVYIDAAGWREAPPPAGEASGPAAGDEPDGAAASGEAGRPAPPPGTGRPRPAGERFRMAVMGDSFVEAIQVPWEDTFVARLEARSAGRTEVLNRGNSSYSPLLSLVRWRRQVAYEEPTHLLLLICPNDVFDDRRYTKNALHRENGGADDLDRMYWRSSVARPEFQDRGRLYKLYRRWRGRAAVATAPWRRGHLLEPDRPARRWREQNPALTPLTGRYLRALAEHARAAGVEFTLSAVPSSWEFRDPALRVSDLRTGTTFADNVAAWAAANGVRYVDLQSPFRVAAEEGERLFFELDGHFTPVGHEVAAEAFAAAHPELFGAAGAPRDVRPR